MKEANALLFVANVCLLLLAGWFVLTRGVAAPTVGWTYQDLITISLSALAVLLAAVTIFLGGAAIWGYASLREGAHKKAADIASKVAMEAAQNAAQSAVARELPSAVRVYMDSQKPAGDTQDDLPKQLREEDGNG